MELSEDDHESLFVEYGVIICDELEDANIVLIETAVGTQNDSTINFFCSWTTIVSRQSIWKCGDTLDCVDDKRQQNESVQKS